MRNARKTTLGLLTFYLTMLIGVYAYAKWQHTADKPVQQFPQIAVNVLFESAPDKINPANTADDYYNLASCSVNLTNPMKKFTFLDGDTRKIRTVSHGVLNPYVTCGILPEYPASAKAVNASGTVTLNVLFDETGKLVKASVAVGHPLLRQAALKAAYQTKISSTLLNNQPVKVSGVLTYQFDIERGALLPKLIPTDSDAPMRQPVKNSLR